MNGDPKVSVKDITEPIFSTSEGDLIMVDLVIATPDGQIRTIHLTATDVEGEPA